ncbi:PaaI family thioesterase [Sneathiella sp.]|jgi:uncharacterized protein (TIGR00369 family)|uniref:PaaI family thioesterase n=1 Tax=Sneathiella sp. TaxID=1964365 RepID=UPI0039E55EFE
MTLSSIPDGFKLSKGRGPFADKIGPLYYKKEDDGHYRYGFLVDESMTNYNGILHGGMMMSFLDEMMGQTIWQAVGRKRTATISLNFDFIASAKIGDWLEMRCDIIRQGVSVVFIRGELVSGDKITITADGVWKVIGA